MSSSSNRFDHNITVKFHRKSTVSKIEISVGVLKKFLEGNNGRNAAPYSDIEMISPKAYNDSKTFAGDVSYSHGIAKASDHSRNLCSKLYLYVLFSLFNAL